MKRDENVEEVLRNDLPSASSHEAESAGVRVLERLQMNSGTSASPALSNFDPRRRANWRPVYALAAAAAIVLAIVLPIAIRSSAPAVLEVAARKVNFGETVKSEMFGEVVKLEDGSRIEMKANSELVLERAEDGVRIRLDKGDIVVSATKQHGHLYVQTKDVTVSVVGTVFYVKAEKEGSRVAVFEGEVHVKQGQTERKLGPGEQVASNPKMESIPVKMQVAWSREAVAHMGVLPPASATSQNVETPRFAFEVASIRPHRAGVADGRGGGGGNNMGPEGCAFATTQLDPTRFAIVDTSVWTLLTMAYARTSDPEGCVETTPLNVISGAPGWTRSEKFDIEANIPESVRLLVSHRWEYGQSSPVLSPEEGAKLSRMVLAFLEDRLKLVVRREMKEVPAYALTLENGASPKFTVTSFPNSSFGESIEDPRFKRVWASRSPGSAGREGGSISGKEAKMTDLALLLQTYLRRPVVDRTGFTEPFDFLLLFRPPNSTADYLAVRPNLFDAVSKQTGLKLEETKATVEFWTIERLEKPSEN